jgi:EmrB/QacA subfamily drug resistance transporter
VGSPWRTFAMVSVGVFAASLDLFVVNIAMPELARDFAQGGLSQLSWVLNGYAITYAALLVPAGRLVDLYGRRRGFVVGVAVFTLASAACALAPSAGLLIAARLVQGAGAAILTPSSLGVVLPSFPARSRPAAVGAGAAVGAVGAAAGPPLGGLLTQLSWRWIFLVNLPLGVVSGVYAALRLPETRDPEAGGLADPLGIVALMGGVATLVLALVKGRDWGWTSPQVVVCAALALTFLAVAVARSRRHPIPALELPMLRVPSFALAVASATAFFAGFSGMLLGGVLYLTQVWGQSVLRAGLELAVGPTLAMVAATTASRVGPRLGMANLGALGGALVAGGIALNAARLGLSPNYAGAYLPGQVLTGLGVGLSLPAFTAVAVHAVHPRRFATAIGLSSAFRQVGAALGVAAFVALVGTPSRAEAVTAYRTGWTFMSAAALLGGLLMLATRWAPAPAAEADPSTPDLIPLTVRKANP